MVSPFAITAPTNGIQLDDERRAEVAFTVFNTSGRPLRARAQLVAVEPDAEPWLSVDGASERPLPIAGAVQYSVKIQVPAEAAAGTRTFRLNVVGADNPDEEYAEGPTVTFEVPEPVVEPKRPLPWWIVAVVAGVFIVGVLAFISWPRNVEVPEVAGQPFADAVTVIQDARLSVLEETLAEASTSIAAGSVVRTDPAGGERVRRGTEIQIVLSFGPALTTVPDVTGRTVAEAREALGDAGLAVGSETKEPSDQFTEGIIIRTEPNHSTDVQPGGTVMLVVSSGPPDKITFKFSGRVIRFDDSEGTLDGSIAVGTEFTGTYTIDRTVSDIDPSLPTVGNYWHSDPGDGIRIEVGNYVFQSDPSEPGFLLEVANNNMGRDDYLLRSYINQILQRDSSTQIVVPGDLHIAWQLDDETATALPDRVGVAMPLEPPDLSSWQQDSGLTIDANRLFIRGIVEQIERD